MKIPGFTAEASVYRTNNVYYSAYGALSENASAVITPQGCRCVRWEWVKKCLSWRCTERCSSKEKCCGVVLPDGTCDGQCWPKNLLCP